MRGVLMAVALMGLGASSVGYLGLRALAGAFMPGLVP